MYYYAKITGNHLWAYHPRWMYEIQSKLNIWNLLTYCFVPRTIGAPKFLLLGCLLHPPMWGLCWPRGSPRTFSFGVGGKWSLPQWATHLWIVLRVYKACLHPLLWPSQQSCFHFNHENLKVQRHVTVGSQSHSDRAAQSWGNSGLPFPRAMLLPPSRLEGARADGRRCLRRCWINDLHVVQGQGRLGRRTQRGPQSQPDPELNLVSATYSLRNPQQVSSPLSLAFGGAHSAGLDRRGEPFPQALHRETTLCGFLPGRLSQPSIAHWWASHVKGRGLPGAVAGK